MGTVQWTTIDKHKQAVNEVALQKNFINNNSLLNSA